MFIPSWIIEVFTALTMMGIVLAGMYITKDRGKETTYWTGVACGTIAMIVMSIVLILLNWSG